MKEKLEERLKELKEEFGTGQKMLCEIETKRDELQQNMLRISGAIQIIEETLTADITPEQAEEKSELVMEQ